MNNHSELLAWVRAARGAVQWHLEAGDAALTVPAEFHMPPLGRAEVRVVAPAPAPEPARPAFPQTPALRTGPPATRSTGAAPAPMPRAQPAMPLEERVAALEGLRTHVGDCTRCGLSGGRKAIVHASGPADARLALLADAPSADDEGVNELFRGPAGELLEKMIRAMGLSREQVYLCTIVMCRPPDAREPTANEIAACGPFLKQRLSLVRPEIVVAFGEVAMRALVPSAGTLFKARGKWLDWQGIPVMPTWGPAMLLTDADKKRPVWDDLKKVMGRLGLGAPK